MTTSSTGAIARPGRRRGDGVDDVARLLVGDLTENGVLAVQVRVGLTVMKNCEPFVPGPALAIASR